MDLYTVTLILGGAGLAAMAGAGAAHLGGDARGMHGGHVQTGAGHHGASHTGTRVGPRDGVRSTLLSLVSPRVLFGLLLGFGAVGMLLRPVLFGVLLPIAAVCGALLIEFGLFAPLWRFLLRFASNPAQTLDASILSEARAASGFNSQGEGLIAVEVDGQIVQCLGTLRADDLALGVRVRTGDVLRVESVDSARQQCTVSYVRHNVDG